MRKLFYSIMKYPNIVVVSEDNYFELIKIFIQYLEIETKNNLYTIFIIFILLNKKISFFKEQSYKDSNT